MTTSKTATEKKREKWPRVRKIEGRNKPWLVDARVNGIGERFFCETATEADTKAESLRIARVNGGTEAASLPSRLRADAIEADKMLAGTGAGILDAVRYFLAHERPAAGKRTLAQVVTEFLKAKQDAGRKDSYIDIQRYVLANVFGADFGTRQVNEITADEIEKWMGAKNWSMRTRLNYFADIRNLFGFAMKRGYSASNPMYRLEKPNVPEKRPDVLTVEQAGSLLKVCAAGEREMLGAVAVGLFAGLRTEELDLMDWDYIDLQENNIHVPAQIAKTSEGRDVEIHETLLAWLLSMPTRKGKLAPAKSYDWRLSEKAKAAGITDWPKNALRHSFASYHFAAFSNAPLTAAMLGHHSSTRTFEKRYKKRVKPSDAKRYWLLTPA
jgi:integrase